MPKEVKVGYLYQNAPLRSRRFGKLVYGLYSIPGIDSMRLTYIWAIFNKRGKSNGKNVHLFFVELKLSGKHKCQVKSSEHFST